MAVTIKQMSGYISHSYRKSAPKYYRCSLSVKKDDGDGREWKKIIGFTPYKEGDQNNAQLLRMIPDREYITVKYYERTRTWTNTEGQEITIKDNVVVDLVQND